MDYLPLADKARDEIMRKRTREYKKIEADDYAMMISNWNKELLINQFLRVV